MSNSLANREQEYDNMKSTTNRPAVIIHWNADARSLWVEKNGTTSEPITFRTYRALEDRVLLLRDGYHPAYRVTMVRH